MYDPPVDGGLLPSVSLNHFPLTPKPRLELDGPLGLYLPYETNTPSWSLFRPLGCPLRRPEVETGTRVPRASSPSRLVETRVGVCGVESRSLVDVGEGSEVSL